MSSETAIRARGIGKCFHIHARPLDRLLRQLTARAAGRGREFWALKDVGFDIHEGETVGVIGKNGSGKSTLLEIISNTLQPSEGEIEVRGRVSALLELGAGFNPEFTGRENVLMNGAILGLSQEFIAERMQDIAEFAEIGQYLDQPVKTYSSGMYVRLAFAAAINVDPDILIVDEALSVGDIRFQRKCFRQFEEFKRQGKTILFVTHSPELVRAHCSRAMFLNDGRVQAIGEPREVVHAYLNHLFSDRGPARTLPSGAGGPDRTAVTERTLNEDPTRDACQQRLTYNPNEYRWGDGRAAIIDYVVKCGSVYDPPSVPQGEEIRLYARVYFHEDIEDAIYGMTVKTVEGVTVYGGNTRSRGMETRHRRRGELAVIEFRWRASLIPGEYFVSIGVAADDVERDNKAIDRRYDLIHLSVEGVQDDFGIADLGMAVAEIADDDEAIAVN